MIWTFLSVPFFVSSVFSLWAGFNGARLCLLTDQTMDDVRSTMTGFMALWMTAFILFVVACVLVSLR